MKPKASQSSNRMILEKLPSRFVLLIMASLLSASPALGQAVLEKGESIQVRLSQALDSEVDQTGEAFRALLDQPLAADGRLLAAAGSTVVGELLEVRPSGKVQGKALMRITLRSLSVGDEAYFLTTNELEIRAEGAAKRDATVIGGGAGVGAIVGAIIGGKKGAAIGAAVGAGAGTAAVLVTKGKEIRFEEEQLFEFVLEEDLRLPVLGEAPEATPTGSDEDGAEERTPAPGQEFAASEIELTALVEELRQDSAETLRLARRRLDASHPAMSLESFFAVHAYNSSVDLFAQLWEEGEKTSLVGVKEQLLSQYERTRSTIEVERLPAEVRDSWEQVGRSTGELDRLYDAFLAAGQSGGRLRWWGRVGGSTAIMLTGDDLSLRVVGGDPARDTSYQLSAPLPGQAVDVELRQLRGRGTMTLLERPSRWNSYRVVILIEDDPPGSDDYGLELSWE